MFPAGEQHVRGLRGSGKPLEDTKEGQGPGAQSRSEVRREALSALDTLPVCPASPSGLTDTIGIADGSSQGKMFG